MRRVPRLLLLLVCCIGSAAAAAPPTVLLISLDGTTPSAARELPTFRRIASQGALADGMIPVFPTNTFPNHVSLVTGVSPNRHGIVNNGFVDPERGTYARDADPTWIEVEPLWSLLARAGIPSASYHWVGSEGVWRSGLGPVQWERFDGDVGEDAKVERILAWLALDDPAQRPRFVTAWFHGADGTAHRYGPDAPQVSRTLRHQDASLGRLLDALAARGLLASTTLLLVSDHGMAAVERSVDLQRALDDAGVPARVLGGGGCAIVVLRRRDAGVDRILATARRLGLEAWPRSAIPGLPSPANPRFGDVFAEAPVGTVIARHPRGAPGIVRGDALPLRGAHGYAPDRPEMRALFAAIGRGVGAGARLGTVHTVDVAPTVLALLGEPVPEWMEGRPIALGEGGDR
jgi:hypothetical protein